MLAIKGSMDGSRRVLVVALRNAPISIRDASSCLELRTIGEDLYSVYSIVLFHNRVYCGTSHDDVLVYNFHVSSYEICLMLLDLKCFDLGWSAFAQTRREQRQWNCQYDNRAKCAFRSLLQW